MMDAQLIAVVIGGVIAIAGSIGTTVAIRVVETRQRKKSIQTLVAAEIASIGGKAERYLTGRSDIRELRGSKPTWISFLPDLGYLSREQALAARKAVVLDQEMQTTGNRAKVTECREACEAALKLLHLKR